MYTYECMCHRQQKFCGREVPQFIEFYHNGGKTFMVSLLTKMKNNFCIYILALKIVLIKLVENLRKL